MTWKVTADRTVQSRSGQGSGRDGKEVHVAVFTDSCAEVTPYMHTPQSVLHCVCSKGAAPWKEGKKCEEAKNRMAVGNDLSTDIRQQLQNGWLKSPKGEGLQTEGRLAMLHCTVASGFSPYHPWLSHLKCGTGCLHAAQYCKASTGMLCLHVNTSAWESGCSGQGDTEDHRWGLKPGNLDLPQEDSLKKWICFKKSVNRNVTGADPQQGRDTRQVDCRKPLIVEQ